MSDPKYVNPSANNDPKSKVKSAAANVSEELKSRAYDAADTVATEASNYADQAKYVAADEVKGVASALRTAADQLRSGSPQERTFSQIASGLADASDALRDKDLGEMVGSVTDFAKRNPLAFLGSAALIGFAATRFAKASSSHQDPTAGGGFDGRQTHRDVAQNRTDFAQSGGIQSPMVSPTTSGGQ